MGMDADAPSDAARQMRGAMFGALAQSAEQFMRSPQFLEMMRDWISASISCRKQLNQFFTGVHHSTESVAQQDVENLLLSLRHLEGRMVERTEQLVNKLESIEQRLDRLEQVRAAHDHAAQE